MDIGRFGRNGNRSRYGLWISPSISWMKINFYDVDKGNLWPTGYWGLVKNESGFFILVMALPLGIQTNHYVEVMGDY